MYKIDSLQESRNKYKEDQPSFLRLENIIYPIMKEIKDVYIELTGVKPNFTELYKNDVAGIWSAYIPVGVSGSRVEYDEIACVHVKTISAREQIGKLRSIFHLYKPHTKIPSWTIKNRYNILVADKIVGKFMRSKAWLSPNGDREYYYIFSTRYPVNRIKGNLYKLLGRFFRIRGERIGEGLPYEVYNHVKVIKEFFIRIGEKLHKIGEGILSKLPTPMKRSCEPVKEEQDKSKSEIEEHLKIVLHHAKCISDDFHRDVATLASLFTTSYPSQHNFVSISNR